MNWDLWRGCKRISAGCKFCYTHMGDKKRGQVTSQIMKTKDFDKPILKNKEFSYIIPSSRQVNLCFRSDFLIEEADIWRMDCYKMMKERSDLTFLFLTKRIERFMHILPDDWYQGYENITVGVSIETQQKADERLQIFARLPIKHKNIICQPLLERINIEPYLDGIELVVVGGEENKEGRLLDYDWVLDLKAQCERHGVAFIFRQCATHFKKDGKEYHLQRKDLMAQARKANINHLV